MEILIINTHLTYPGWSKGKLNLAFMDLAKAFFFKNSDIARALEDYRRHLEKHCL